MTGFYDLTPEAQVERVAILARTALGSWGLEALALDLIKYRENAVFRVAASDGQQYALRVHRAGYHTDIELRSELTWMRALLEDGFDVPEIVPASSGELFVVARHPDVPEPRQVDLLRWVNGRPLGAVEGALEGDAESLADTFRTIGVLAARLHNQAQRWTPPAGFTRHAWDTDGLVGERPFWGRFWELAALTDEQRALIDRARRRVRTDLERLERSSGNYGLIHADFAPENLMVDGDRIRLLDFDDAGYGWHLFEIATSLYFHIGQPYFAAIERAMLEGYRSARELSAEDEALLPLFYAARSFTYLGWVHTRQETETARELTPMLVDLCCGAATRDLDAAR
jgi:Ser/Thr protein kinase RdoA (MazF antagonist)